MFLFTKNNGYCIIVNAKTPITRLHYHEGEIKVINQISKDKPIIDLPFLQNHFPQKYKIEQAKNIIFSLSITPKPISFDFFLSPKFQNNIDKEYIKEIIASINELNLLKFKDNCVDKKFKKIVFELPSRRKKFLHKKLGVHFFQNGDLKSAFFLFCLSQSRKGRKGLFIFFSLRSLRLCEKYYLRLGD